MISLPAYVQILSPGYGEKYLSKVIRSEFERGPAKQRSLSCNGMKEVTFDAIVCDEDYQSWLSFFRNDISSGADWFEFADPSHNPAVRKKARIVASDLISKPSNEDFQYWKFTLTLEMYD